MRFYRGRGIICIPGNGVRELRERGIAVTENTFETIWRIARRIPAGRVATYGQLALLAGNPRLSRIAGCAMHSAPADVPCHRVVNRRGELCAAFLPCGKETHRLLLEAEGVPFLPDGRVDLAAVRWDGRDSNQELGIRS